MIDVSWPQTLDVQADLASLLVCTTCQGVLSGFEAGASDGQLSCQSCGATYPFRNGIPILLPSSFDTTHLHDEIDHIHKHGQAHYYDRVVAEEFEIERPHGTPEAYQWLLGEKFLASIKHLSALAGAVVVDVCSGSGMDAEMLARCGARVMAVDISEGCARRARERARRYGLDYLAVVADVEHLPLLAGSVDIGYVHDGLHHLADPASGLRELARVARSAVSVTEPADAVGTALAVRLGLALECEDSGNRVARLSAADVEAVFRDAGFDDVIMDRYLMYYRHEPGRFLQMVSRPPLLLAYKAAEQAADALLGKWGNKLQVTARRRQSNH